MIYIFCLDIGQFDGNPVYEGFGTKLFANDM